VVSCGVVGVFREKYMRDSSAKNIISRMVIVNIMVTK
jgi:hypothetical protein